MFVSNNGNNNARNENDNFIIGHSKNLLYYAIGCFLFAIVIVILSFIESPSNAEVVIIPLSLFLIIGTFLGSVQLRSRVVINGKTITAYFLFKKSYSFTFNDILDITEQITMGSRNSESARMGLVKLLAIRTRDGKKVQVNSAQVNFDRFFHKLVFEVPNRSKWLKK